MEHQNMYKQFSQNDISEFVVFIIESFHNSISRPVKITVSGIHKNLMDRNAIICYKMIQTQRERNYSEIHDKFIGRLSQRQEIQEV
jgi:hypothetical protein